MKTTHTLTALALITSPLLAQQAGPENPTVKATNLIKQNKFPEAIKLLDQAITEVTPITAESTIHLNKLLGWKAYAHLRNNQPELRKATQIKQYELTKSALKKYPDNLDLTLAYLQAATRYSSTYNSRTENQQRAEIRKQVLTTANDLLTKHPQNPTVKLASYNATFDLARTHRWSKNNRNQVPDLVKKSLQILDTIKPENLPAHTPKPYLTLQTLELQTAVETLAKNYDQALQTSTKLLPSAKALTDDPKTPSHHIATVATTLYHHAFLLQKTGKKAESKQALTNLLSTLDQAIERHPNNQNLKTIRTNYEKYKTQPLK